MTPSGHHCWNRRPSLSSLGEEISRTKVLGMRRACKGFQTVRVGNDSRKRQDSAPHETKGSREAKESIYIIRFLFTFSIMFPGEARPIQQTQKAWQASESNLEVLKRVYPHLSILARLSIFPLA